MPLACLLLLTLYHPDFDLDEIPDDRDLAEVNTLAFTPSVDRMPTPRTEVKQSSKRKRRRKTRKSSVDDSSDAPNVAVHEEVKPLSQSVPENPQLRELEPETFHIYASSEGSDSGEQPVSQKPRTSIEHVKQEASEPATPDITDHSSPEDQAEPTTPIFSPGAAGLKRSARSKIQSPEKGAPKVPAGRASKLGPQISSGFTAVNHPEPEPQADPAHNPPSPVNDNGHWLCPFAEAYSCTKSFSSKQAARRHAGSHVVNYTCFVCKRNLTRPDTLKRHMERHTALEISVAEAGKEAETLHVEADDENDSDGEQNGMKNDTTIEYTTPMEASQFEAADEEDQVIVDEDQAGNDEDPEVNPAPPLIPEQPSTPPDLEDSPADILIRETPIARQGQKRKREVPISGSIENASSGPRKRIKEIDVSSSTLVPSSTDSATNIQAQQVTEKIVPQLQPRRQSSIEGWAQAYKPGSNLRHPTLNPAPSSKRTEQLLEVVVPRTSQGSTSLKESNKRPTHDKHNKVTRNRANQEGGSETSNTQLNFPTVQKSDYTTTNGKGRAAPGVEYSSPSKTDSRRGSGRKSSGIATSVAKRTFPKASADEVNGDAASEDGGAAATNSDDEVSTTEITLRNMMNESFECGTCHMKFSSEKALKRHLKKPNVHTYLLKCQTCSEKFMSTSALARHETESGHGKGDGQQGQVGAFNDYEVQKLNNWKDRFCEEHNITGTQFNDMMTDTLHRGRGGTWNWAFIKRTDFMSQYLNVLPNRNKRSMLRYRERNFQNVEGSLNWTEEDDRELIRLQKEMGSKWSKIAKVLMRTQDAVSQRWRHKLQYTQLESGEWSRAENILLTKAMEEVRRQSGVAADAQDWNIPWVQISEKVKTRTPQQCSNHWRALHHLKVDGKWVPVSGLEKTPGASRILTPSKMQKRLAGTVPTSLKQRTALSSEYVQDDDTDEESVSETRTSSGKGEAAQPKPKEIESDSETSGNEERETPHTNRNLLTKRTPGKTLGSSQLFAQTQANTSALKPPPSNSRRSASSQAQSESKSQERPSPNVPIQRRAVSRSPLQDITPLPHVEVDMAENDDAGDVESGDDTHEDAELQESEVERSDAEDEVMADASEIESSDADDKAMVDESEVEDESDNEDPESGINDRNETDHLLEDEAEETSEEDSSDEDGGDEDSEDESEGDEQQSSVDDENNDFMDSINELAQRVKSSQVRLSNGRVSGLRKTHKSKKDESEDEETESE